MTTVFWLAIVGGGLWMFRGALQRPRRRERALGDKTATWSRLQARMQGVR